MGKTILICFDGTDNYPGKVEHADTRPIYQRTPPAQNDPYLAATNVEKLWRFATGGVLLKGETNYAVCLESANGKPGVALYLKGVGTDGVIPGQKTHGQATGHGVDDRLISAYRWLAGNYQEGDEISLIGFSRGAFTARSFAGMLNSVGLPDSGNPGAAGAKAALRRYLREGHRTNKPVFVKFCGCFDTVGSLLLSASGSRYGIRREDKHQLSPDNIGHFSHALALDEQRELFTPTFWEKRNDPKATEVWFVGAHSDVGGGESIRAFSNVALVWMADQLKEHSGLRINERLAVYDMSVTNDFEFEATDSYKNFYRKPGMKVVSWFQTAAGKARRPVPRQDQRIHGSVAELIDLTSHIGEQTGDAPYCPAPFDNSTQARATIATRGDDGFDHLMGDRDHPHQLNRVLESVDEEKRIKAQEAERRANQASWSKAERREREIDREIEMRCRYTKSDLEEFDRISNPGFFPELKRFAKKIAEHAKSQANRIQLSIDESSSKIVEEF